MTKLNKHGTLVIILLIAIIAVGGIIAWSKYSPAQPIEISTPNPPGQQQLNQIYIGGAVTNPGFYPLKANDTTEALIQVAGGTTSSADLTQLKLYVPQIGEELQPQKININLAEAWLIEALPGIGETRAQAIINYRNQNGLFRNINELTKVEGIGATTYEKIKPLITVAD
jgi:competence protein ComEA